MNWISAHSIHDDFEDAWNEVRAHVQSELTGEADLIVLFVSAHHAKAWRELARYVHATFPHATLFGGSSRGTIAGDLEFEEGASITLLAGTFGGGGSVETVHILEEPAAAAARLKEVTWSDVNGMLILADPFSSDAELLLTELDVRASAATKVGGILCGGTRLGDHGLWDAEGVYDEGALLLLFRGTLSVEPVVAQSAKPIGDPLIVMRRRGYLVDAFNTGKPSDALNRALDEVGAVRKDVWEKVVIGLDVGEGGLSEAPSDYLIRSVIGLDPASGSLAVAAQLENYQTLRFHLRDADAARTELRAQLEAAERRIAARSARAAIVFNCLSRGVGFFGTPHEDAKQIAAAFPDQRVVGLVCGGEIGPVASRTYLHSLTTSVGVICERDVH